MHPESKLTNHGKASSNGGQSQPANVSQGSKGTGLLGPKPNHMSPSGVGVKTTQNQGPNHGNGQREPAGEVAEQKEPGTPSLDPEPKGELLPRSKRRCVLERKQPYSGDEWCSGPDSEEDEKNLVVSHNCSVSDSTISAPTVPGSGSASLPGLNDSSSSSTTHGASQSLHGEGGGPGGPPKAPSQYVYVFTTYLANTAAEAVLQGRADSILLYHQQNVPRAKLDEETLQKPPSTPDTAVEDSVPTLPPPTSPAPASHPTITPLQAPPNVLQTEVAVEETKQELTPNTVGNNNSRPASSHSNPPPPASSAPLPVDDPGLLESTQETTVPLNTEGLSREQLEHRERSLQTLRDIERLLLRSGAESESFSRHNTSPVEGSVPSHPPPHVPSNPPTPIKKYEEPLQSMITQTQSLGGPGIEQEMGGPPSGPDMGHQMSLMMQRLGQDSLTPEQAAWRKLQEEYYAEKRRKEEHMTIHGRSAPDLILRGPPPPYHNKPGEQWVGNRLPGSLEGQEVMQLRGGGITFQGPRFPGRYGLMQNIPMDSMGTMQRPGRWPEDMTPMGGGQGSFPQGGLAYPGGGQEVERFLNPSSRDEFLRQQLLEKRSPVLQRQLSIPSGQGTDMERVIMQQRSGDPSMFQGDGLGSEPTMGMDFGGSRNMVSPTMGRPGPGRELESAGGGGNLNMNMSVNMNMNLNLQMTPHQQMLLSQKMRNELMGSQAGVGSEDMVRSARVQNGGGMPGGGQKMVVQDGAPTQNPLSLMMSQMSKYAMPSSTPLYHNAIKTIATSDDDLLPDRVLLPPGQQGPGMNPPISLHLNLSSSQSPIGNIGLQGQPPLSHEPPNSMLNSPGPPMHPSIGPIQTPLMIPSVTQDSCCPGPGSQMMSSNPLVFPPRLQPGPPHNPSLPQGGGNNSMQQHYPDEAPNQPRMPPRIAEPYGPGLPAMLTDPELGEVIRPSPSGIPEFDLSRIMPSEKPSSTLQYFPKGSTQPPKPHPTNMHLLGLQNMMVEQHSGRSGPSLPGPQRTLGMPPMHPMGRTGMAPPSQTVQQNFMLMKQRSVSGEMYPQSSSMLSPQGALGGHLHGQQSMMVGHQMRQRSVSLDTYIPGPGHLPF
ncbi:B-cell CLL/lymphoma 9-like protein isoform X1 [Dendropsophus ebraccatus]|uniref:B-cell CLL/lymphoma 9-like protein isoform X1 n=1 Tax=Dendropsophus ebraccatus TaxID=150705 RepID=UPI00383216F2